MQSVGQTHVPFRIPAPDDKKVETMTPSTSGNTRAVAEDPNVELNSSIGKGRSQYPEASPEEILTRTRRASGRFNPRRGGVSKTDKNKKTEYKSTTGQENKTENKSTTGQENKTENKSATGQKNQKEHRSNTEQKNQTENRNNPGSTLKQKPKLTGGSNGPSAAVGTGNDIAALPNAFPPASPPIVKTMRDTFLSSVVSNFVSSSFTVGQQLVSKGLAEKIDAQSKMPGAQVKNPDGTKGTVDPAATQEQKMQASLTGAEIKTETLTNSIIFINEGPDANAVEASPDAPKDTQGRLTNLEKRMDAIESQMQELAKRYGLIYTPYVAPDSSEAPTDESRMQTIEKRYAFMNIMINTLVTLKQKQAEAD